LVKPAGSANATESPPSGGALQFLMAVEDAVTADPVGMFTLKGIRRPTEAVI
jgi:hypothetical protein